MTLHEKIVQLSSELLTFLRQYRETHPDFRFWLRSREHNKAKDQGRLKSGQWFQGSDYIFLSFHSASGHVNMTRSIGWVVEFDNSLNPVMSISLVWPKEQDQRKIDTYFDIIQTLGGFEKLHEVKYKKRLPEKDVFESLTRFLDETLPQINAVIERHGMEKEFNIPEEKFLKRLNKVLEFQAALKEGKPIVMDDDTDDDDEALPAQEKSCLNTILYGPPGTGKTYHTIDKALQILDADFYEANKTNRNALTKRFRSLLIKDWKEAKGQIAFITFHQSMNYEDFVEGIKPLEPKDNDGSVKYAIEDGIFKKLCALATQQTSTSGFEGSYQQFINDIMENNNLAELKTPSQKKPFHIKINSNHNVVAIPQTETATEMVVTKEMLALYLFEGKIKDWKPYTVSISEYIKSKYPFSIEQTNNLNKPYVLIIDEINRGNISQIFGELITLIEDGKRQGQAEELSATLPYSKMLFTVPSNLYVIGTMNTADRSVEALDTALRRRFMFEEKMPDVQELSNDVDGVDLQLMISKMNERLEVIIDRDHTIGHAWLMSCKDVQAVKTVFENKILPLLKEFFYNDHSKIGLVIGQAFFEKATKYDHSMFAAFPQLDVEIKRELVQKPVYRLRMPPDEEIVAAFQSIYTPTA